MVTVLKPLTEVRKNVFGSQEPEHSLLGTRVWSLEISLQDLVPLKMSGIFLAVSGTKWFLGSL